MPASNSMRPFVTYMRKNPQVFVLLVICVVLGLGTFLAVIIALASAGSGQTTGEPSGSIPLLQAAMTWATGL